MEWNPEAFGTTVTTIAGLIAMIATPVLVVLAYLTLRRTRPSSITIRVIHEFLPQDREGMKEVEGNWPDEPVSDEEVRESPS